MPNLPDVIADLAPTESLRAAINLGNPVLAHGTPEEPGGVSVDIARELGRRLDLRVELTCVDAARESFEALRDAHADIAFLAIEPARASEVRFTAPYAVLEAVYAVPADSSATAAADVDRAGVRIGVKRGSAYDLFLTRTLEHASVVRGDEGADVFTSDGLEVAAGLRVPLTTYAAEHGLRVLEPPFQQIRQAVAIRRAVGAPATEYVADVVEELKGNGFVAASLRASGRDDAQVAPAE